MKKHSDTVVRLEARAGEAFEEALWAVFMALVLAHRVVFTRAVAGIQT